MEDLLKAILKNPIGATLFGAILFYYVPGLRVYIAIIVVVILIVTLGKNGFVIYFAYSALGALLSMILSFLNETSSIYQQIFVSVNFLTFATLGSIVDLIFYLESSGWNWFENLLAFICFSGTAILIQKFVQ
ncbi:MAG: hypothetical protein CVV57_01595 [Tenericutes bacterium HGW-Tenericutes-2]|jgi:hypothetical protein|nr:MAG: hypothetical protein CVV57_01595 [Tenericutes bacterium HGW-Tenericutes-2]